MSHSTSSPEKMMIGLRCRIIVWLNCVVFLINSQATATKDKCNWLVGKISESQLIENFSHHREESEALSLFFQLIGRRIRMGRHTLDKHELKRLQIAFTGKESLREKLIEALNTGKGLPFFGEVLNIESRQLDEYLGRKFFGLAEREPPAELRLMLEAIQNSQNREALQAFCQIETGKTGKKPSSKRRLIAGWNLLLIGLLGFSTARMVEQQQVIDLQEDEIQNLSSERQLVVELYAISVLSSSTERLLIQKLKNPLFRLRLSVGYQLDPKTDRKRVIKSLSKLYLSAKSDALFVKILELHQVKGVILSLSENKFENGILYIGLDSDLSQWIKSIVGKNS